MIANGTMTEEVETMIDEQAEAIVEQVEAICERVEAELEAPADDAPALEIEPETTDEFDPAETGTTEDPEALENAKREAAESRDSLVKIQRANDRVSYTKGVMDEAAQEHKAAKKTYEEAVEYLRRVIDDNKPGSAPLLDAIDRKAAEVKATPEPGVETINSTDTDVIRDTFSALLSVGYSESQAREAIDRTTAGDRLFRSVAELIDAIYNSAKPPTEDPQAAALATPLDTLNLSPAILKSLAGCSVNGKPVTTVGLLGEYTKTGTALTAIKGIGESKAEQILDALATFWETHARPAVEVPAESITGEEAEEAGILDRISEQPI